MNFKFLFLVTAFIAGYRAERISFSSDFLFGAATASYQIEGAWQADGKLPSIWDTATHKVPSIIRDNSSGDDAGKSYEFFMKDVQALKDIGFKAYRFSVAWTRVLTKNYEINQAGIDYYHRLIDALLAEGIQPMITIYHWDLPQWLQDIGGWTNPEIIKYYVFYADLLFNSYGDKVKTWITFNEPGVFCDLGYSYGSHAPHISTYKNIGGHLCSHHVLLAHAQAYHLYQDKYVSSQKGEVAININCSYMFKMNATVTQETTDKAIEFMCGRYLHPIFSKDGDYPPVMREAIDRKSQDEGRRWSRLPKFTPEEVEYVKRTADFIALNYYSSNLVAPFSMFPEYNPADSDNEIVSRIDPNWPQANSSWLFSVPEGLYELLKWFRNQYDNPKVYIVENGWSDQPMEVNDHGRVQYLKLHLKAIHDAIKEGCKVEAYTVWSLVDNFEWMEGYVERFGIYALNFTNPERERIPKLSAQLFEDLMRDGYIDI